MSKDLLLEYISKYKNTYSRYLQKNKPELYDLIKNQYGNTISEKCFNYINDNDYLNHTTCRTCNKSISSFISFQKGYRNYCSNKCSSNNLEVKGKMTAGLRSESSKSKRKESLIKRYGTDSLFLINKSKIIKSNNEKYGVDFPFQSQTIRETKDKNVLAKYGVKNVFELDTVKKSIKHTNISRFGVEKPLQNNSILIKQQSTMIDRHGAKTTLESKTLVERIKETNIQKYGTANAMKNSDVATKASRTQRYNLVKSGNFAKLIEKHSKNFNVEPLFSELDYIENNKRPMWKHVCGNVYESLWGNGSIQPCPAIECRNFSTIHRSVYEYINSIISTVIEINNRSVIKPKELDIWIPEFNLAIEIDGIYWHQNEKDLLFKKIECAKFGIKLLHITDYDWYNNEEKWKSIISAKLNKCTKYYARKCAIKEVSKLEVSNFLNENHYQNSCYSLKEYGLYHDNELISVMTFGKPRFNKNYEWELLRFCNKKHTRVLGGASKLLKRFLTENKPKNIISYSLNEYGTNELYESIGFNFLNFGVPSYSYIKNGEVLSRYKCQKHKLSKFLSSFDSLLTEEQNMINNGYMKFPTRGSSVFELSLLTVN